MPVPNVRTDIDGVRRRASATFGTGGAGDGRAPGLDGAGRGGRGALRPRPNPSIEARGFDQGRIGVEQPVEHVAGPTNRSNFTLRRTMFL